jgi:signal transduction histidine kinase
MLTGSTAAFTALRFTAHRRAAEAAFLSQASLAIGLEPDAPSALRAAVKLAVPTLGDWAAIDWAAGPDGLERVADAAVSGCAVPARDALAELARRAALRRLPECGTTGACPDAAGTCAAVPIVRQHAVLGVLMCGTSRPRGFTSHHLDTLDAYAQRIAAAVRPSSTRDEAVDWRKNESTLAMLAHELRTPVSAVLGWIKLLQSGRLSGAMASRALDAIERSAETQSRLVTDMFDLSRIMMGTYRVRVEPIDIATLAQASVDAIAPAALARGLKVRCVLPGSAEYVDGDASRLQQVITNVLTNSVNHTPPGGRIALTIVPEAERITLRVVDSGDGIAPELLPHIFEPLMRSLHGDPTHDGAGLGLTLVRHIVELHGGQVTAESDGCGRGAVFTLTLPRGCPPEIRPAPVVADKPGMSCAGAASASREAWIGGMMQR